MWQLWNLITWLKAMVPRRRMILCFVFLILLHFSPKKFLIYQKLKWPRPIDSRMAVWLLKWTVFIHRKMNLQFLHASFAVYLVPVLLKASSKELQWQQTAQYRPMFHKSYWRRFLLESRAYLGAVLWPRSSKFGHK